MTIPETQVTETSKLMEDSDTNTPELTTCSSKAISIGSVSNCDTANSHLSTFSAEDAGDTEFPCCNLQLKELENESLQSNLEIMSSFLTLPESTAISDSLLFVPSGLPQEISIAESLNTTEFGETRETFTDPSDRKHPSELVSNSKIDTFLEELLMDSFEIPTSPTKFTSAQETKSRKEMKVTFMDGTVSPRLTRQILNKKRGKGTFSKRTLAENSESPGFEVLDIFEDSGCFQDIKIEVDMNISLSMESDADAEKTSEILAGGVLSVESVKDSNFSWESYSASSTSAPCTEVVSESLSVEIPEEMINQGPLETEQMNVFNIISEETHFSEQTTEVDCRSKKKIQDSFMISEQTCETKPSFKMEELIQDSEGSYQGTRAIEFNEDICKIFEDTVEVQVNANSVIRVQSPLMITEDPVANINNMKILLESRSITDHAPEIQPVIQGSQLIMEQVSGTVMNFVVEELTQNPNMTRGQRPEMDADINTAFETKANCESMEVKQDSTVSLSDFKITKLPAEVGAAFEPCFESPQDSHKESELLPEEGECSPEVIKEPISCHRCGPGDHLS